MGLIHLVFSIKVKRARDMAIFQVVEAACAALRICECLANQETLLFPGSILSSGFPGILSRLMQFNCEGHNGSAPLPYLFSFWMLRQWNTRDILLCMSSHNFISLELSDDEHLSLQPFYSNAWVWNTMGTPVTYFCPALDPPLGRYGRNILMHISQSQKCDPTDTDEMWKMNFNYHTFWIMWHQGQDVKSQFLKNPPHAFHHKDFMLFLCVGKRMA